MEIGKICFERESERVCVCVSICLSVGETG